MLVKEIFVYVFIKMRNFLFIPPFLNCFFFIMNVCWTLSNAFLYALKWHMGMSFIVLILCITLMDFWRWDIEIPLGHVALGRIARVSVRMFAPTSIRNIRC